MEGPILFWGYKEQESNLILLEHDDDDDDDYDISSSTYYMCFTSNTTCFVFQHPLVSPSAVVEQLFQLYSSLQNYNKLYIVTSCWTIIDIAVRLVSRAEF